VFALGKFGFYGDFSGKYFAFVEGRRKREEGRGKREEGRGKREEGRGKREEGRRKREEGRSNIISV
jgi:hypothetical protein